MVNSVFAQNIDRERVTEIVNENFWFAFLFPLYMNISFHRIWSFVFKCTTHLGFLCLFNELASLSLWNEFQYSWYLCSEYTLYIDIVLFKLVLMLYLFLYVLTSLFFTFKEITCRQYVSGSYFYFQDKLNIVTSDLSLLRSFILTVINDVIETKSTVLLFSIYLICSLFPFYFSFPSFGLFFMILFYLCYCLIKYYFLFGFVLVVAPRFIVYL